MDRGVFRRTARPPRLDVGRRRGGLLLATSSVFRRRLRPMQAIAIDIATFLLGGATLALAQLSIGHASVPWSQTHWVEFFVFGGGASVALIHLADFHERL